MSNYVKATNFYAKDALLTGNPDKLIKGSEIDDEFNAIATAIATKANLNSPNFTGTPTVPTATMGTNNTQAASTAFAIANGFPSGGIAMWSGSILSIPSGWVICDGTNSTPDLRNKFIIGAGSTYAVGATGGSKDAIVVSHTHSATVTDAGHTHTQTNTAPDVDTGSLSTGPNTSGSQYGGSTVTSSASTLSSTTGITVANSTVGSSGTDANLPPYYALCFIMKV